MRFCARNICSRYGGDEFAILLPGVDAQRAHESAETLRVIVERAEFIRQGQRISLTISVGVSSCAKTELYDSTKMIKAADRHLLAAKQAGRNVTVSVLI